MDNVLVCSECDKLNPEVSYQGYCWHRKCLDKVFKRNVKDPALLAELIGEIWDSGTNSPSPLIQSDSAFSGSASSG